MSSIDKISKTEALFSGVLSRNKGFKIFVSQSASISDTLIEGFSTSDSSLCLLFFSHLAVGKA
jgi:hypothetical protein